MGNPTCQHVAPNKYGLGAVERLTIESRDDWAWDQCPSCGETWNYRWLSDPASAQPPAVPALIVR